MWEILFTSKARKQVRKLPQDMQVVLNLLAKEIQQYGPMRTSWPHYGKLKGRKEVHHCHLNKGKPRYVAVWQVTDTTIKLIEVQYVGTHEKHHTSDVTEICLRVPTKDAQQVFEATKQFLLLAGLPVQETNEQGEPLYTLDEVFPDSHPGVALKGYRIREGITQKALAKQLEISPSNLSDMEHGRRPISKAMAKRIEKITGIGYKVFL